MLNHCFDDVERFMGRLQQAADAQGILNQRRKRKKRSRKSKKEDEDGEMMIIKEGNYPHLKRLLNDA